MTRPDAEEWLVRIGWKPSKPKPNETLYETMRRQDLDLARAFQGAALCGCIFVIAVFLLVITEGCWRG